MIKAQKVVIDCDPGIDDAIALLLALATGSLEILAITTVVGNVPLELTQANARRVCELADRRDLKVYSGCPRPLLQPPPSATDVHGNNGLGGGEFAPSHPATAKTTWG